MRAVCGVVAIAVAAAGLVAPACAGEVTLVVRADGSKVIVNRPPVVHRGADYSWLAAQRGRPSPYDALIERRATEQKVDPLLVKSIMLVESNYDPRAVSRKGASGLMQLMPATAKRFGVERIFDPEENVRGGVSYLAFLLRLFGGDLTKAVAAYNAGENAVLRHGGVPPYAETQEYVRKVMAVYHGRPSGPILVAPAAGKPLLATGSSSQSPAAQTALVASATLRGLRPVRTHVLNVR
jgi:soluble lytic murein transglycosylase-like protein